MIFGCLFSHLNNFASPGGRTRFSFVHPRHVFESLRCNILRPGKPCIHVQLVNHKKESGQTNSLNI